jgi:hypothetical protein
MQVGSFSTRRAGWAGTPVVIWLVLEAWLCSAGFASGISGTVPAAETAGTTPLAAGATAVTAPERKFLFGRAHVLSFEVGGSTATASGQLDVIVRGYLPDPCTRIASVEQKISGQSITLTLYSERPTDKVCAQVITPFLRTIPVNVKKLGAGDYWLEVNGIRRPYTYAPTSKKK